MDVGAQAALERSIREDFANPSAGHRLGRELSARVEEIRQNILRSAANEQFNLVFTSSATEANNLAICGQDVEAAQRIWVSLADHPSLVRPAYAWQKAGVEVCEMPLRHGWIDWSRFAEQLNQRDRLMIFSHINNSSGQIQETGKRLVEIKDRWPQLHVHVDAVQSYGKMPSPLKAGPVDSITISGHKMGGPKGVGALLYRRGCQLRPQLLGGGHELGLRSSTLNVPGLVSWFAAIAATEGSCEENWCKVALLNRLWRESFSQMDGVEFPFYPVGDAAGDSPLSPYILLMRLRGIPSDILMRHLDEAQIYVSSSSACSSRAQGENPVYKALGLDRRQHGELLRISFSQRTTQQEVARAAQYLAESYQALRRIYDLS